MDNKSVVGASCKTPRLSGINHRIGYRHEQRQVAAKRYFDTMPGVHLVSEYAKLTAYIVQERPSYFLQGSGQIEERSHNNLLLTGITGAEIVLKYHYVPGMVAEPPARIEGVRILDDPHLFVRIANPPPRLRRYLP